MRRSRILAPLLPLALTLAACGGGSAPTTAQAPAPGTARPSTSKALTVGGTDLRLGGATTDDGSGQRSLAGPSRPDPSTLGGPGREREGVGAGASCADQDLLPSAAVMDRVVDSTLCLLNGERADAGLGSLKQDPKLTEAAVAHARDMVAKTYFAHDAPDGSSSTERIRATGYIPADRAWTVGENLAWGTGTLATPRSIVAAWMGSPGHRENILRPVFDEIGFGVVLGNPAKANGLGATYATSFGSLGAAAGQNAAVTPAAAQSKSKARSAPTAKQRKRARAARRRARAAKARAARRAKAARARS